MALTERVANETVFGSTRSGGASGVAVNGTPGYVVLVATDGTEVCIWARNDGKLYGGTRTHLLTPEASGTALW